MANSNKLAAKKGQALIGRIRVYWWCKWRLFSISNIMAQLDSQLASVQNLWSMHVHFVGIGGTGIGPLALIAYKAGYVVSGSDKQGSGYIDYLRSKGITSIFIGQTREQIEALHEQNPIDWLVYSSAVAIENPDHPELAFARACKIKASKRDEFLNELIEKSGQKLIAVAGTHGKTTTTAMVVWLLRNIGKYPSYSVGAKLPFGDMGNFDVSSEHFVYECDEYDRNFLAFKPYMSLISGVAHDHHDIYPTEESYKQAFRNFLSQSQWKVLWQKDAEKLGLSLDETYSILQEKEPGISQIQLVGEVNRLDGWLAVQGVHEATQWELAQLIEIINRFPGVSRRFEKITDNLYTDYAHTPEKIAGCLQLARELSKNITVVHEPLTNKRQHEIRESYAHLFDGVKKLYWVPSYLTREDPNQPILTPAELIQNMSNPEIAEPAELNDALKGKITQHLRAGDLVVGLSGGGGGSLDEWLRANFSPLS